MTTKSKSKAWLEYSAKVDDILGRMYDTNYQGQEVTADSPECVDAILRLSNLSIKMGVIDFFPLKVSHNARIYSHKVFKLLVRLLHIVFEVKGRLQK